MRRAIAFSAKTLHDSTQWRGFVCAPSCCGLAGAGTLAPGSIQRPESIAAVRFVVAIAVVDLSRCFCFAKTFVVLPDSRVVEERWRFSLNIEDGTGYENGSISFLVVFCTPKPAPEF